MHLYTHICTRAQSFVILGTGVEQCHTGYCSLLYTGCWRQAWERMKQRIKGRERVVRVRIRENEGLKERMRENERVQAGFCGGGGGCVRREGGGGGVESGVCYL